MRQQWMTWSEHSRKSQIAHYHLWLKGGSLEKGFNQTSLKLKLAMYTSDPKLLAKAMRSYPEGKDLNTRTYVLEGFELFGSTKRKMDLPPRFEYDSHRPDKVNYFIPPPPPYTRSTTTHIEEPLVHDENVVSNTTSMLESECPKYQWHILDCRIHEERMSSVVGQHRASMQGQSGEE